MLATTTTRGQPPRRRPKLLPAASYRSIDIEAEESLLISETKSHIIPESSVASLPGPDGASDASTASQGTGSPGEGMDGVASSRKYGFVSSTPLFDMSPETLRQHAVRVKGRIEDLGTALRKRDSIASETAGTEATHRLRRKSSITRHRASAASMTVLKGDEQLPGSRKESTSSLFRETESSKRKKRTSSAGVVRRKKSSLSKSRRISSVATLVSEPQQILDNLHSQTANLQERIAVLQTVLAEMDTKGDRLRDQLEAPTADVSTADLRRSLQRNKHLLHGQVLHSQSSMQNVVQGNKEVVSSILAMRKKRAIADTVWKNLTQTIATTVKKTLKKRAIIRAKLKRKQMLARQAHQLKRALVSKKNAVASKMASSLTARTAAVDEASEAEDQEVESAAVFEQGASVWIATGFPDDVDKAAVMVRHIRHSFDNLNRAEREYMQSRANSCPPSSAMVSSSKTGLGPLRAQPSTSCFDTGLPYVGPPQPTVIRRQSQSAAGEAARDRALWFGIRTELQPASRDPSPVLVSSSGKSDGDVTKRMFHAPSFSSILSDGSDDSSLPTIPSGSSAASGRRDPGSPPRLTSRLSSRFGPSHPAIAGLGDIRGFRRLSSRSTKPTAGEAILPAPVGEPGSYPDAMKRVEASYQGIRENPLRTAMGSGRTPQGHVSDAEKKSASTLWTMIAGAYTVLPSRQPSARMQRRGSVTRMRRASVEDEAMKWLFGSEGDEARRIQAVFDSIQMQTGKDMDDVVQSIIDYDRTCLNLLATTNASCADVAQMEAKIRALKKRLYEKNAAAASSQISQSYASKVYKGKKEVTLSGKAAFENRIAGLTNTLSSVVFAVQSALKSLSSMHADAEWAVQEIMEKVVAKRKANPAKDVFGRDKEPNVVRPVETLMRDLKETLSSRTSEKMLSSRSADLDAVKALQLLEKVYTMICAAAKHVGVHQGAQHKRTRRLAVRSPTREILRTSGHVNRQLSRWETANKHADVEAEWPLTFDEVRASVVEAASVGGISL